MARSLALMSSFTRLRIRTIVSSSGVDSSTVSLQHTVVLPCVEPESSKRIRASARHGQTVGAQVGWGLWLTALSAAVLCLTGLTVAKQTRRT